MSQKSERFACSSISDELGDYVWVVDWICLRLQELSILTTDFNSKSRNPQETVGEIPLATPILIRRATAIQFGKHNWMVIN